MLRLFPSALLLTSLILVSTTQAATLQAAYVFNKTLAAQQAGVPALAATDPLGQNAFGTDTVYGSTHSVYGWNGNTTQQAGLTFNDGSKLITPNSYSVEMVFQFADVNGWRRILDVESRTSDNGFYINPGHNLDIYPLGPAGFTPVNAGTYYDIILTNNNGSAKGYVNGGLEFAIATTSMDLNQADNPGMLMNLFLDNTQGGGQGEYSNGKIALFEAFDGVLTDAQAASLAAAPFANVPTGGPTPTPEPVSGALALIGLALTAAWRKRG